MINIFKLFIVNLYIQNQNINDRTNLGLGKNKNVFLTL